MRTFADRVAVVTGAASGIGRATAELLARRGCHLALVDVNQQGLAETAARIEAAGRRASMHKVDVADRQAMQALAAQVIAIHGHVHILVNNAGVGVAGTFAEMTLDDLDWIVGINFWGVIATSKLFLPYLCAEDEGHVVNVSSVLGFIGIPGQSAYCATKFAVRGFSEALYAELSGTGVGVTSVHPGAVRTNIVRASRFYDRQAQQKILSRFERVAIPPERVARAIVRAIERRKLRVIVGADSHVLERAKRLLPVLFHRAAAWTYRRYGLLA